MTRVAISTRPFNLRSDYPNTNHVPLSTTPHVDKMVLACSLDSIMFDCFEINKELRGKKLLWPQATITVFIRPHRRIQRPQGVLGAQSFATKAFWSSLPIHSVSLGDITRVGFPSWLTEGLPALTTRCAEWPAQPVRHLQDSWRPIGRSSSWHPALCSRIRAPLIVHLLAAICMPLSPLSNLLVRLGWMLQQVGFCRWLYALRFGGSLKYP